MYTQEALKMLNIVPPIDKAGIKQAYRKACSKFHPDKGGSTHMMQLINEAYTSLKDYKDDDFKVKQEQEPSDIGEKLNTVINQVINLQGVTIEITGSWIWLTGETKIHKEAIKAAGFKYSSNKKSWYYASDLNKKKRKGRYSMDKIRATYGSQKVETKQYKKIA